MLSLRPISVNSVVGIFQTLRAPLIRFYCVVAFTIRVSLICFNNVGNCFGMSYYVRVVADWLADLQAGWQAIWFRM